MRRRVEQCLPLQNHRHFKNLLENQKDLLRKEADGEQEFSHAQKLFVEMVKVLGRITERFLETVLVTQYRHSLNMETEAATVAHNM